VEDVEQIAVKRQTTDRALAAWIARLGDAP